MSLLPYQPASMSSTIRASKVSDFLQRASVYEVIGVWSEQTPEAIAITAPGRAPLMYGRLRAHMVDVIEALRARGIGRNDRVAIVLPNGPEMASAFLAISSCATFAPLNPACRAEEFDFYLSDLNAKALMVQAGTDSPALTIAQKYSIPVIELSSLIESGAGNFSLAGKTRSSSSQGGVTQADDVALILYTSGTTSRPKMVPLTHSNLLSSANNIAAVLQLTGKDRCLNVMPLFHIHGLVGAVLSSLTVGSSVVCTSGFDGEQFSLWLEEFRPSWYTAAPTIHQAVLERVPADHEIVVGCPLRLIRSASAPLPQQVMEGLERLFSVPVIEAYGMTEAANQITSNPLPPGKRKPGSVGMAMETEVSIIDEQGKFLSSGRSGEILVRGTNVIRGYGNNPEANKEAFSDGWLRTGDLGYLDEDGYLFITGRLKEIINRGGEKISPNEIDEVLLDHPDIREAATFAVPHPSLGEDIAAAVITLDSAQVTEQMIREYLFDRLAEFKMPSRIYLADEIPKNATGKVRRSKLTEKFFQETRKEFILPKNKLEIITTDIYAEVLGVEKVGVCDNFFALGGDSLRATQVISRVRSLLQVNLPIATLFNKSTPAELAEEIARSLEETDRPF